MKRRKQRPLSSSPSRKPAAPAPKRTPKPGSLSMRMQLYFQRHAQAFFNSLGRIKATPLASGMTIMVIGIALALPMGLYLVVKNLRGFDQHWQNATQLSVFLQQEIPDERLQSFLKDLEENKAISSVHYQTPEQVLEEFSRLADVGDSLNVLQENPLPGVVIVQASDSGTNAINTLVVALEKKPEVDFVQLDRRWLERLYAIVDIGKRAILVLACLLALAVLLVVGNTIRLGIEGRRAEIQITKLIGGTDSFIRRPFLYSGLWYGLFGGVFALILINIALLAIRGPVKALARLYDEGFGVIAVDFSTTLIVVFGAILLGWIGSWLAVSRHLRDIQPN